MRSGSLRQSEHTPVLDVVFVQAVVDGEEKAFCQRAVMAEMLFMDARVEEQRVDVGKEAVEKIVAKPCLLRIDTCKLFLPSCKNFRFGERTPQTDGQIHHFLAL
ncbi:MAG: hypothetical protein LBF50_02510 [Azoarcus sp.]|jgi:hypothetical protein|nr:hypothetical protein [Azoarcus sp.]